MYTIPPDGRAQGVSGHIGDHNNIADMLTLLEEFNPMNTSFNGGAKGDGVTDDTLALQNAITAAAEAGSSIYIPPAPGGCYRTSGLTIPEGLVGIHGWSLLDRVGAPATVTLTGSVFAPISSSVTNIFTVGTAGGDNPSGLTIEGIGFLGTLTGGNSVANMWAVNAIDTQDILFFNCKSVYNDSPGYSQQPSGGGGTGGAFKVTTSSGSAENFRIYNCHGYGDGRWTQLDATDGRVISSQSNGHKYAIFASSLANAGGMSVVDNHFSSSSATNHINIGTGGTSWTYRIECNYFDVCTGAHIASSSRGNQIIGNYFLAGGSTTVPIQFASSLNNTTGGANIYDPAAIITGNVFDINGQTTPVALVSINGFTGANVVSNAGGVYRDNVCHNRGAAMPASWKGTIVGSDNVAAANSTTQTTIDLQQGPVLT